ncbi:MAG: chemotaxis protein CheC [Ectothiorhodospiraceae bacterium]|nr:chemotaxis protein CheC [Ectothiorhodospiraceae bacterium]
METFGDLQKDLLAEAFNLGMGRAAASLSEMVHEEVLLSAPEIVFMNKADAAKELGRQSSGDVSGVSQDFSGSFGGEAMLLFPIEKSLELVRLLLQDTVPLENLTEFEEEALNEIGNIILNAGLSSLADLFKQEIQTELPSFRQGSCEDLLQVNTNTPSDNESVLLLRVDFKLEKNAVDGYVLFLLDIQSTEALIDNINIYLKSINVL